MSGNVALEARPFKFLIRGETLSNPTPPIPIFSSGWCFDTTASGTIANCFGRAGGGGGSSAGMKNGTENNIGGLLSEDPAVNPYFFSANLIFMCVFLFAAFLSPSPYVSPPLSTTFHAGTTVMVHPTPVFALSP